MTTSKVVDKSFFKWVVHICSVLLKCNCTPLRDCLFGCQGCVVLLQKPEWYPRPTKCLHTSQWEKVKCRWGMRSSKESIDWRDCVFLRDGGGGCFFSTELFHIHQLFADQNPSKCHAGEVKDQDPPIWLIGNPVTNQSTLKLKRLKQSTVKHILTMIFTTRFSFTSMFPTPLHFQAASRPHHLLPPSTKPDQTSDVSLNHKLPLGLRWGSPIFYVALVLVAISILQESPGTRKMSFYCKFEVPLLCIYNEMQDLDFLHGQAGQSAVAVAMCSSATNR